METTSKVFSRVILFLCFITVSLSVNAQTMKPQWMHKAPRPNNNSYTFLRITADATNLDIGRSKCFQLLALDQSLLNTLTISYSSKDLITSTSQTQNGNFNETLDQKTFEVITTEGKPIQVKAKIIDEYFCPIQQSLTTLYQVAIVPNAIFDNCTTTTKYSSDPATLGLMLIPGAAQFHKGSYLKGGLVLGGSVALAGGALACGLMRKDNMAKYENAHNTSVKEQYRTRINGLNTGMYCCIGGLAALYIYNIIDAIVAPGARRIIVYPAASTDGSVGLGATVKF